MVDALYSSPLPVELSLLEHFQLSLQRMNHFVRVAFDNDACSRAWSPILLWSAVQNVK